MKCTCFQQIVMKRLQRMVESECGEEAVSNIESGVLAALRLLCAALERRRPDAFRHVARQATRAPSAMLRSDTALAELALALARRITRENITWSKVRVYKYYQIKTIKPGSCDYFVT